MKKKLGGYNLGRSDIIIYVDTNFDGGCFNLNIFTIGIKRQEWWEVLEVLLHELTEFNYSMNHCRLTPDIEFTKSHDSYLFLLTHPQFSECTAQIANCLAQVIPDLTKVYNEYKREKRTTKKIRKSK
jgi:hypothetical protein